MSYCIELLCCPDPHRVLREAAASVRDLAEALAPREVERAGGQLEAIQPSMVEIDGTRVHVIPLQQEVRADGSITEPRAVVIVDGPDADRWARRIESALREDGQVMGCYHERPDGTKIVLDGPGIANTGAQPCRFGAESITDKSNVDV